MNNTSLQIEGLLFWKGESMTIKELSKILSTDEKEIENALRVLDQSLSSRGIKLVRNENTVELRTDSSMSDLIERLTKEELDKDLGRAGLETIAIILYEGPISRKEIDYIRGVNSQFIIRNLMIRGLIEKIENTDGRGFSYKPTIELLSHLGISSIEQLPEYKEIKEKLNKIANHESVS